MSLELRQKQVLITGSMFDAIIYLGVYILLFT